MTLQPPQLKQTELGLIPKDWETGILKDFSDSINYGYTQSSDDKPVGPKFLRITDIQDNFIDWDSVPYCKISDSDYLKYKLNDGDIVIARTGASTGAHAIYHTGMPDAVFASYLIRVKTNNKLDPQFSNYFLKSNNYKEYIKNIIAGSAQPNANAQQLTGVTVPIPPISEQQQIASILSSLDDKIELNRKMNKTLESIAKAIFKRWFVETEATEIIKIGDVVEIYDSRRIPLSNREREQREGNFPYYGATSIMDYVDDYIFDGTYLLIGEDGSVAKEDGKPFTQYVWGKFWVNNHAHVLKGKNGLSTELLKVFFDNINIKPYVTGAVQPKLNQNNLLNIPMPKVQKDILENMNKIFNDLFSLIKHNSEQINSLSNLRDSLLPRLMSGRIRVE